jgi:hypothetical protein
MRKEILTLLGCSGSLAMSLLTANVAEANTLTTSTREFVFTAPQATNGEVIEGSLAQEDLSNCGCGTNAQETEFTDSEGEKAIALFGCDCPGHRFMAQNMVRSGTLPQ